MKLLDVYPTLTVFLVWIGKELLEDVYKEICIICVTYIAEYNMVFNNTLNKDNSRLNSKRQDFKDQFVSDKIENKLNFKNENLYIFKNSSDICDFLDKFLAWYYHFEDYNLVDLEINEETNVSDENLNANESEIYINLEN